MRRSQPLILEGILEGRKRLSLFLFPPKMAVVVVIGIYMMAILIYLDLGICYWWRTKVLQLSVMVAMVWRR